MNKMTFEVIQDHWKLRSEHTYLPKAYLLSLAIVVHYNTKPYVMNNLKDYNIIIFYYIFSAVLHCK